MPRHTTHAVTYKKSRDRRTTTATCTCGWEITGPTIQLPFIEGNVQWHTR